MTDVTNNIQDIVKKTALPKKWRDRLQLHIQTFLDTTGMKASTFGHKSIDNQRFWKNFLAGGTVTVDKADEIYKFMASQGFNFKR